MVIFGPSATNRRNSITMLHIKDLIWTLYFIGAAVALEVTIVPDQGEISLGESKFFLCQVSGEATDISWYSPTGEKLLNQQQISVVKNDEYTSTLTIYNVSSQDAGIYKCVASSETEGESEGTVNLKIYQKLTFKYAPTPQEFTEGEDAVIICDVSSSIPSIITWRHKGKDVIFKKDVRFVVLANNYLQIRGIKKTDEGNYRCEGRILARGEINYKDIQVIVNVPPLIQARQIRVNATANMDESVVLSCDADGFPDPEISWLKKGEPIEDGEEKISFNEDKSEMTIYRVEKEDEAEYSCIANNQAGEAEAIVLLKVYAKPKITYVENKTAVELDEITLTCEASGDPIPSITWRTAHRNISSEEKASWTRPLKQETLDGHIVVKDHIRMSALTLKDIQYTDAGEYFCVASNPIGVDMQAMYFEVQYAPKIRGPVVVYTWEGNPVNITCDVLAHPSAAVSWFRDGQLLPSSNFSNIKIYNGPTFSSLEVNPDSENDFGNYNCSAVNSIGHESSEFILVQADTPSSPAIRKVEPYSSTVMIVFDEPDATGGVPILKYKAEWRVVGQEKWHARYYDAKEVSAESIITVTGLKPETSYMVKLSAVNGKGLGDSTPSQDFTTQPVREPSAPKLVGHLSEDGNSIKVDIIKQDDGGSPIRHYLVNYRALNAVDWKPEMRVPSNSHHVTLKTLEWNVDYEVIVVAENQQGKSKQARLSFRTTAKPTATTATTSASTGLGTGAIVGILIVTFVLLLVVVDVTCFFLNKCGLLMCIAVNFCGKAGPGAKGKDIEEGKAAFSKDESKEPIVEVRTEEERTPNHDGSNQIEPNETTPLTEPEHPADTTATVEDMLPSVTTVTTNSDTITETFATAQNSPTSETTTLTSSTAPPPSTAPDSNTVQSVQATPSKAEVPTASSPPPTSSPKVAPLVDLSDTPTNNPSKAVANQAGALNPSVPASAAEPPKAIIKPVTTVPANTTSPPPTPEPKQVKQEQSGTKSPEKESAQPSTVKSPTEPTKDESASLSNTKPLQGEDFQIDGGTFKTPEIDLAKDVFAALGTATPAAVASGKASELVSSTADTTVPPDSAKTEKTQVEENSKPEETDVKSTPAEVKTVPNEATQTNVNESKA
ncbi:neural cell adhesion molecule 1-B isoform X3 [Xenopus laevis]|uniref:Neural cell adhesion molecule 1-B isoform X3 n=1 Tax=Xenopus laevis TaxID=8355 RepID=A0A8J0T922_XENLA|nr:neural cell adhesion molecule 1-B isoform X3 [Xenopus laevis]